MYHGLLTRKYLTSKVMPLLAALAVMLCTATVLVVWSVMGGFLNSLLASGRTMAGDVMITWPTVGFAHYGDLMKRLEDDRAFVAATSAQIETFGLVNLPDGRVEGVQIKGIDPASYARVVDFADGLWWKPIEKALPKDVGERDERLSPALRDSLTQDYEQGLAMAEPDAVTGRIRPAAVTGIEMLGLSRRQPEGYYARGAVGVPTSDGGIESKQMFAPRTEVTLRVLPLDRKGRTIDTTARVFPVANELRTGVYEIDKKSILVPLATLQQMLKMDEAIRVGDTPAGSASIIRDGERESFAQPPSQGVEPARVTTVLVRAASGVTPDQLAERCRLVYKGFAEAHRGQVPSYNDLVFNRLIRTWEDQNATLVGAVKRETAMVLFLLCFISFTVSVLILAIFWSIVSEKTRDIGILRAIGASAWGVAWLWLRYGIAIGVIGASAGLGLALAVVLNINEIHDWLGRALGLVVWDPRVYYFSVIPNQVEVWKAAIVVGGGLGFSMLGAIIPALRAASLTPVRALRFE